MGGSSPHHQRTHPASYGGLGRSRLGTRATSGPPRAAPSPWAPMTCTRAKAGLPRLRTGHGEVWSGVHTAASVAAAGIVMTRGALTSWLPSAGKPACKRIGPTAARHIAEQEQLDLTNGDHGGAAVGVVQHSCLCVYLKQRLLFDEELWFPAACIPIQLSTVVGASGIAMSEQLAAAMSKMFSGTEQAVRFGNALTLVHMS